MPTQTFTIDLLQQLVASGKRPSSYVADCQVCDTDDDPLTITFDTDSDCYRALKAKFQSQPTKPAIVRPAVASIDAIVRPSNTGGCGCSRAKRPS